MQDRLRALLELSVRQSEVGNLFLRAEAAKLSNDYQAASIDYHQYVDSAKALLAAEVAFNSRFPEVPLSLPETVRPIINALMVRADIEDALAGC